MPRPRPTRRLLAGGTAAVAVAALLVATPTPPAATAAPAAVTTSGYAANDYCLGECGDILPPGQNGNATLVEMLGNQALGTLPRHSADQLGRYANLVYGYAGLREEQIGSFFNDASFGVPQGQVERDYSPRADVTHPAGQGHRRTARHRHHPGRHHVRRRVRRGRGPAVHRWTCCATSAAARSPRSPGARPATGRWSRASGATRPYNEADLQAQIEALRTKAPRGQQLYADVQEYIAGINAYIARLHGAPATAPASTCSPATWTRSPTRVARSRSSSPT